MERILKQALHRIMKGERGGILCAVSGGVDSMTLLFALRRLRGEMGFPLYAAHYHHGLRETADRDAAFVTRMAQEWGIPLWVGYGDVKNNLNGRTVEEAAREMRYDYLERTRRTLGCSCIAVAHHSGDQAETVLLNLFRGAGVRGLRAMEERRGRIIRPMLGVSREEIVEYAEANGIPHVEDESNADMHYRRNRIRKQLIPLLQREYNPAIIKALCNTARAAGEDEACLAEIARNTLGGCVRYCHEGYAWVLDGAALTEPAIAKRVIRLCLEDLSVWDVDGAMLTAVLEDTDGGRRDIGKGVYLLKKREVQIYRPATFCEEAPFADGAAQLPALGLTARMDRDWDGYTLRTRRPGDRLHSGGLLADAMKKANIPRCIRDSLGVVVKGGVVCAAEHLFTGPELAEKGLHFYGKIWKKQGGFENGGV